MTHPPPARYRSKTLASWIALVGGSFGLQRLYLYGVRDPWAWLCPWPTLLGIYGVLRARALGLDDHLSWLLIPLLGLMLSATMLHAIVIGLTDDAVWNARFNSGARAHKSGWLTVFGVILALAFGAAALMATLSFSAQRFFEYRAEQAGASPG
jgi:hypothetical protein